MTKKLTVGVLLFSAIVAGLLAYISNDYFTVRGAGDASHGCLIDDGYTWCAPKNKCLKETKEHCSAGEITYYCEEGSFKALYKESSVDISLPNKAVLEIPQTVSGSGIRFELGKTILAGKGDKAYLSQNDVITYNNCVAGNLSSANLYSNNNFSLSVPQNFVISGGAIGYSQDWSFGSADLGNLLLVLKSPRNLYPKTNFSEARFTIGVSDNTACLKARAGETKLGDDRFKSTDAGAGNYYETTSYRMMQDKQCYALEYTIHYTNILNYSSDQGVSEFNKPQVEKMMQGVVDSFKFLD